MFNELNDRSLMLKYVLAILSLILGSDFTTVSTTHSV